MEKILKIVTINHTNEDYENVKRVLDHTFFTYRICDINISIDNTVYVYMLISIRQRYFAYIGKTDNNSGIGSQTSQPVYLLQYSVFTYIFGFNGNQSLVN